MDGQLYWATGKQGRDIDLAGLVCNQFGSDACINEARGTEGGVTWAQREWELRRLERLTEVAIEEYRWSQNRFDDQDAA